MHHQGQSQLLGFVSPFLRLYCFIFQRRFAGINAGVKHFSCIFVSPGTRALCVRCLAGYWAVVQSTLGLSGEEIWQHLAPCMDAKGDAAAAAAAAVKAAKALAAEEARAAANKRAAVVRSAGGAATGAAPGSAREAKGF